MINVLTKIANIQKEIGSVSKNAKNPFYKSNYADLNNIKESLQPFLEAEKLMAFHAVNDNHLITTIFDTESGEQVVSSILLSQTEPQKKGSEITYYRRYNLVSIFDLKLEDDDGNMTVKTTTQTNARAISTLDDKGYAFLISDKSTKEQVNMALKERKMKPEQKGALTELLKTK